MKEVQGYNIILNIKHKSFDKLIAGTTTHNLNLNINTLKAKTKQDSGQARYKGAGYNLSFVVNGLTTINDTADRNTNIDRTDLLDLILAQQTIDFAYILDNNILKGKCLITDFTENSTAGSLANFSIKCILSGTAENYSISGAYTLNTLTAENAIIGINTLSATANITADEGGKAYIKFAWDFGGKVVEYSNIYTFLDGETKDITATAALPSSIAAGTYTLYISGAVQSSITFEVFEPIIIETNITDYTTQTSGITLIFTGNVKGKWIDQPSEFNFVSNNENIRTYTANGNYKLLIYGDLANITNVDFTNANIVNTLDLKLTGLTGQEFGLSQNKITELNIENLNVTQINQDYPGVYGLSSDIQKIYAKNTKLSRLWNDNNTWTNLDYLDLTNVTTLLRLYLSETKLSDIAGFNTLINLEQLYIENVTTLISKTLDISDFTNLKTFVTTNTDLANGITGLNQTTKLEKLSLLNNNIGSVLDLSQNSNIINGGLSDSGEFLNGNNFTEIILNNSKFSFLNGVYDTLQGSDNLTKLHIQNNVNLDRVSTKNKTLLTDVNLTGSRLFRAYFDGCALTQISIDNVIQTAVNGGVQNGALNLQGGTNAAPSSAGLTNINTLVSRGWTVNHN